MTKAETRKLIAANRPDFQTLELLSAQIVNHFQRLEKSMSGDSRRRQGYGGQAASFQPLELFQTAKAIGAYMPLPDEVKISSLFPDFKRQIYIPAFDESIEGYRMAKYTPEMKKGLFGIPEPLNPVWAEADELDLILVPGMAFDFAGNRLGRGGGFYDRLLPQYDAIRAGICFDFQTLEEIPTESHDCRVDLLVTESKILKFATNS